MCKGDGNHLAAHLPVGSIAASQVGEDGSATSLGPLHGCVQWGRCLMQAAPDMTQPTDVLLDSVCCKQAGTALVRAGRASPYGRVYRAEKSLGRAVEGAGLWHAGRLLQQAGQRQANEGGALQQTAISCVGQQSHAL